MARLLRNKVLLAGVVLTGLVVVLAAIGPSLTPFDYSDQDLGRVLLPPRWAARGDPAFPLGTDYLGRDILTRMLFGARISLLVGVSSVLVSGIIGTAAGVLAAYHGGWVDTVIMRFIDIQLSFPPVFIAIAAMAVVGKSLSNLIIVLAAVTWVRYARVARGAALSVREREFVEAARALGSGDGRIMFRHLLPNIISPMIVIATVNVSAMILTEASLSFLGLGVQPPLPTWGGMLNSARSIYHIAWWNSVFPGLAIVVTVIGINLLGEGLKKMHRR